MYSMLDGFRCTFKNIIARSQFEHAQTFFSLCRLLCPVFVSDLVAWLGRATVQPGASYLSDMLKVSSITILWLALSEQSRDTIVALLQVGLASN